MKVLAFDLGKVLFDFDYGPALDAIAPRSGANKKKIHDALFIDYFSLGYERGDVSTSAFFSRFCETFKIDIPFDEFNRIWSEIFTPQDAVIEMVRRLSLLYPVYLISNICEAHYSYLAGRYPRVFSLFDGLILSYKVRSVKPEPAIYEALRRQAGVPFKDIVYIDDRRELTDKAAQMGLRCIHFTGIDSFIKGCASFGVIIPGIQEHQTLCALRGFLCSHKNVLLVGMGNSLRSDDGVGPYLIRSIEGNVLCNTLDAGESLENYLGKINKGGYDLICFIDAADYRDEGAFKLFFPSQIQDISLHMTHDSSLKLAIQYLKGERKVDILLFGIKGDRFSLGGQMSPSVIQSANIIKDFFMRQYSHKQPLLS